MKNASYRSEKPRKGKEDDLPFPSLGSLLGKGNGGKLDEKTEAKLARFNRDYKLLRKQIGPESEDIRSDSSTRALIRAFITSTLSMIPLAERQVYAKKSESSVYAFCALINQLKDLTNMLRGMDSLEEQADHIVSNILFQSFVTASNSLLNSWLSTVQFIDSLDIDVRDRKRVKRRIDDMIKQHGKLLDELSQSVSVQVKDYLLGGPGVKGKKGK